MKSVYATIVIMLATINAYAMSGYYVTFTHKSISPEREIYHGHTSDGISVCASRHISTNEITCCSYTNNLFEEYNINLDTDLYHELRRQSLINK